MKPRHEVLAEVSHDLPLVRFGVTLLRGGADDGPSEAGLAQFACELATRGAGGKSRALLDEQLDALGGDLSVAVGHDAVTFDVDVLERHAEAALGLLADVVLRPDFDEEEAEQLVRETLADLDELRDDDPRIARRHFVRALFGAAHPYGRPSLGTERTVERFTAEGARRWIERALCDGSVLLSVAGDIAADRAADLFGRRFGVLRQGDPARASLDGATAAGAHRTGGPRVVVVDKPGRTQSQIYLGQIAIPWADPDFVPLSVATNAFGGTFTARLMNEVRSKRGLSYGASARLGQGRGAGGLVAHVFPAIEKTGETLGLVLDLWRAWVDDGLSDEEVRFARENLAASFAFETVTPEDRLDLRLREVVCEVAPGHTARAAARTGAVTPEEVRAAMRRHLTPDGLTICLLTTAKQALPQLAAIGLTDVEVVPFDVESDA